MPSKSKLADVCSLPEPSVEEEERVDLQVGTHTLDGTRGAVPVFFETLALDCVGMSDEVGSVEAPAVASTSRVSLANLIFSIFAALAAAAHFFFAPSPMAVRKNKESSGIFVYKEFRDVYTKYYKRNNDEIEGKKLIHIFGATI